MATKQRESLKILQERLASRLAEVKKSGAEASWLAVEVRGQRLLLPLVHAGEIFPLPVIQPVPHTGSWFLGVAALRGGLVGLVDLASLLSLGDGTSTVGLGPDAKLVALNSALGVNAALLVDRVVGLRGPSMFAGVSPKPANLPPMFAQLLTDVQGQQWQELNLLALVQWPEFLNVVA